MAVGMVYMLLAYVAPAAATLCAPLYVLFVVFLAVRHWRRRRG